MTTYQQPESPAGADTQPTDQTQLHPVQPTPAPGGHEQPADPQTAGPFYAEDDGYSPTRQRERFGGVNWGAALFGWMVSTFLGGLLIALTTAAVVVLGLSGEVLDGESRVPSTPGLVVAASFLAALVIAHYSGGYVAGRMSRFDGGKQGVAVWVIALLLTGGALGAGLLFGSQVADLDRLGLPALPVPADLAGLESVIIGVAALLSTLLAAVAGGKVGCRYHHKVDEAAYL